MDGILFLLSVIAIGIVILWCRENDNTGMRQTTSGFLALREPGNTPNRGTRRGTAPGRLPKRR